MGKYSSLLNCGLKVLILYTLQFEKEIRVRCIARFLLYFLSK